MRTPELTTVAVLSLGVGIAVGLTLALLIGISSSPPTSPPSPPAFPASTPMEWPTWPAVLRVAVEPTPVPTATPAPTRAPAPSPMLVERCRDGLPAGSICTMPPAPPPTATLFPPCPTAPGSRCVVPPATPSASPSAGLSGGLPAETSGPRRVPSGAHTASEGGTGTGSTALPAGSSPPLPTAAAVIDAARAVFRSSRIGDDAGLTVDGSACWALGGALDAPLAGQRTMGEEGDR